MSEYNFPTETIDLPSEGLLYPENSPLRSGKVDIKYMTAKEEDILTSTNLIQKGVVIDKLMESLIVSKGVRPDDLLLGDITAVMIAARILGYGKEYPISVMCGACNKKFTHTVDLTQLQTNSPTTLPVNGEYPLTLPTGVSLTFKLLTRADEKAIAAELASLKKLNYSVTPEVSTRLRYVITSVDGNREAKAIRAFVDAMIVRDIKALRDEIARVSPEVDFNIDAACEHCGDIAQVRMPLGANFFWPDLGAQG
jgi:hypothetical protein